MAKGTRMFEERGESYITFNLSSREVARLKRLPNLNSAFRDLIVNKTPWWNQKHLASASINGAALFRIDSIDFNAAPLKEHKLVLEQTFQLLAGSELYQNCEEEVERHWRSEIGKTRGLSVETTIQGTGSSFLRESGNNTFYDSYDSIAIALALGKPLAIADKAYRNRVGNDKPIFICQQSAKIYNPTSQRIEEAAASQRMLLDYLKKHKTVLYDIASLIGYAHTTEEFFGKGNIAGKMARENSVQAMNKASSMYDRMEKPDFSGLGNKLANV